MSTVPATPGAADALSVSLSPPRSSRALGDARHLSLNDAEWAAVQAHFKGLKREPTLAELETIAQTWSEHCKHKTFTSPIKYTEGKKTRTIKNLFQETIVAATEPPSRSPGACRVFEDNAGVVAFDEKCGVCLQGRDAQPPVGARALRRRGHRHRRRDPRHARHAASAPSRSQHRRLLLRPARTTTRSAAARARCIPRTRAAGRRRRRARLRQPHGHPDGQRRGLLRRRAISAIRSSSVGTVGLIPRDESHKHVAARRPDRRGRRAHRAATAFTARRSPRRAATRDARRSRRRGADRQRDQREEGARRAAAGARPGPLHARSPTAARAASRRRSARWARDCGARCSSTDVPLKYAGLRHWEIWMSRGAGADGARRAAEEPRRRSQAVCAAEDVRGHGASATFTRRRPPARRTSRRRDGRSTSTWSSCTRGCRAAERRRPSWPGRATARRRPAARRRRSPSRSCCEAARPPERLLASEWIIRQYDHEVQGGTVDQAAGQGVRHDGPRRRLRDLAARGHRRHGGLHGLHRRARHQPRYGRSTPTGWRWPRRRGPAQPGLPSAPTRRARRCSTTSAGATPS